jgi:hypothetical protein
MDLCLTLEQNKNSVRNTALPGVKLDQHPEWAGIDSRHSVIRSDSTEVTDDTKNTVI